MRRSAVALIPVVGALLFAACSENDNGVSRSPTAPALNNGGPVIVPATSCDFNAMTTAAKAYFSNKKDVVFTTISLMQTDRTAGNTTLANGDGYTMLNEVASSRLTSATVASQTAAGAAFVNDVLRCTTYTFPPATNPDVPQKFLDNLALILTQGVFEIRGGPGDQTISAAAYLSVGGVKTLGAPTWGVQAHGGSGPVFTWPTDGHFVVYGYPILDPNLVLNPATNINTNGPGTFNSFELGSIPDSHSKLNLLVGVCFPSVTGTTAANRLIHQDNQLFDNTPPTLLCQTPLASVEPGGWLARSLRLAGSLFVPKTATAMQGLDSFIGGLPDGWSPYSAAQIVGTDVGLTFTTQPVNTIVQSPVPVVVQAVDHGLGVPGVSVTITVFNNLGAPAGAVIVGGNPTLTTDSNGFASFNIAVNKPGGYLLNAAGAMSVVVGTSSTISAQFQVKQIH